MFKRNMGTQYAPPKNSGNNIDFNPSEIEQMEPEFEECPHCKGSGYVTNGIIDYRCPVCHGCEVVPVKGEV